MVVVIVEDCGILVLKIFIWIIVEVLDKNDMSFRFLCLLYKVFVCENIVKNVVVL